MSFDRSIDVQVKTWDPNATSSFRARANQVEQSGDSSRHRLQELLWSAIENHDKAIGHHETAVKVVEERMIGLEAKIKSLEVLIWRAIVAMVLMVGADIWLSRHH